MTISKAIPLSLAWLILLLVFRTANAEEFTLASAREAEQVGWASVAKRLELIRPPTFPNRILNITELGGVGDGRTDNRQAIADAIEDASQPGGKIVFPQGDYFVDGPIHLKSNVHLHLEKSARIFFGHDAEKYLPAVKIRFEGTVCYNYSPQIYGIGLSNIAITGEGMIDGNAKDWSKQWRKKQNPDKDRLRRMGNDTVPDQHRVFANGFLDLDGDGKDDGHGDGKPHFLRPSLLELYECENILIEGLTIKDSPFWTVHPVFSKNIVCRNLTVLGSVLNDDGIDPDSCQDVLIEGCTIKTRDDAISIKAGRDQDAWGRLPSRNIIVRNNKLLSGVNAFCIGSEMSGGVEYVFAENNYIAGGKHALNFKCNLDRGGKVQHIYLRNFDIDFCADAMFIFRMDYHGYRGNHFPTESNDFYVSNIRCGSVAKTPINIIGVEDAPIRRVFLSGVTAKKAGQKNELAFTKDVIFDHVNIAGKLIKTQGEEPDAGDDTVSDQRQIYVESGGLVAMEAESTSSPLGHWVKKTSLSDFTSDFTGSSYLDFSGNEPSSGPATSPLEYQFRIIRPGLYILHLRCARQAVGDRKDWANDCYVRIEGDYGSGPNAGHRHEDDATLSVLKGDTKFYGGDLDRFTWSSGARLDPGGKTNKRVAVYDFKANEEYRLVVSGRSQFFKLDRIVLRHCDVTKNAAEAKELVESKPVMAKQVAQRPVTSGGPPAGRLAIVTDGNALDPDDVCATPVALALLRASGLEKRLVHFCHSCELKNKPQYAASGGAEEEVLRRQMNQVSCDGTATRWGGFDHITFWNCRTQRSEVVAELLASINASTAEDPLWIIEAGEPDVIYEAAVDAKPGVMQYVTIITHHPNNDRGVYHHLDDLLEIQSPGAHVLRIPDQNKNLKNPLSQWHWARDHSDPKINWLWERGEFAANRAFGDPKFGYKPIKGKFDASDAGMTLYWLTGAYPNGLQQGTPADIRDILIR